MPANQNFRRHGLSRTDLTQMLKEANKEDQMNEDYRKHLRAKASDWREQIHSINQSLQVGVPTIIHHGTWKAK